MKFEKTRIGFDILISLAMLVVLFVNQHQLIPVFTYAVMPVFVIAFGYSCFLLGWKLAEAKYQKPKRVKNK